MIVSIQWVQRQVTPFAWRYFLPQWVKPPSLSGSVGDSGGQCSVDQNLWAGVSTVYGAGLGLALAVGFSSTVIRNLGGRASG